MPDLLSHVSYVKHLWSRDDPLESLSALDDHEKEAYDTAILTNLHGIIEVDRESGLITGKSAEKLRRFMTSGLSENIGELRVLGENAIRNIGNEDQLE
jgi:hypothetical protein